jgi:hypothetical protein
LVRNDSEKADDSMRFNNESDSKITSQSERHFEKLDLPSFSTERGIIIVDKDDSQNANDSILFNKNSDSKITVQSSLQNRKQNSGIV